MYSLPTEDLENIKLRVEGFWPRNSRFFITGGTGFFGRWLVESISFLEEAGAYANEYVIVSRQSKAELERKIPVLQKPWFQLIQHDLKETVRDGFSVDYVIHAASDVAAVKNSGEADFEAMVNSTRNVISALRNNQLKKFLYVSSGGVYAPATHPYREEELSFAGEKRAETYGDAKKVSELLVRGLGEKACSARCFSFAGPYADPNMAVMDMLLKKVSGDGIIVKSPDVVRSFMYPTDLVAGLFKLLFLKTSFTEYNLGSGQAVCLADLAEKIAMLHNTSEVKILPTEDGKFLAGRFYVPDTSRFDAEFSPAVTVGIDQALQKTFNFLTRQENKI